MFTPQTSNLSSHLARSCKAMLIAFSLVSANLVLAEEKVIVTIPTVSDARVFAEFKDKMPAVVNYFTKKAEDEIIAFYQEEYGQPLTQDRKRGRLTLSFSQEEINIRVVISHQNNVRQVDVIVEDNTSN